MKKILFASTALVALTGTAVADVELSGRAKMGIFDQGIDGRSAEFFTDIDVTFTMTGETDGGLEFGASVDLDEGNDDTFTTTLDDAGTTGDTSDDSASTSGVNGATGDNTDDGGVTIFVKGSFGTVTMGDMDGALDWALTEAGNVGNPGSIADDETSHAGYIGSYLDGAADGQILRYDYSAGAFGVAVSIDDDNGNGEVGYAIGFKYTVDLGGTSIALGLGHQEGASLTDGATTAEATGVSATATLASGLSVGVVYADWDDNNGAADGGADSNMGIGIGYSTGAFSVHANYGEVEFDDGTDADGFGIAAAYDLGGGAVVHFGYGDGETAAGVEKDTFSLGLGLSF